MSNDYPVGWDPYAWHDHHRPGKPQWRVKAGMFEQRDALCVEFNKLNQRMAEGSFSLRQTMSDMDEWDRLKVAILACEEVKSS